MTQEKSTAIKDADGRKGDTSPLRAWYQAALGTAVVAGVFSLIVCAVMVTNALKSKAADMRESAEIKELKQALAKEPGNEATKQRIRARDLRLRQEYFRRADLAQKGTCLLLGGIVVFLLAGKCAAACKRKLPAPPAQATAPEEEARRAKAARWSVAGGALLLSVMAAGLAMGPRDNLPVDPSKVPGPSPAASPQPGVKAIALPSPEEFKRNWPRFRGPSGLGVSAYTNVPSSWNGKTGEGILWKAEVPLPGPNSPVVWGDRIFLSGATRDKREVFCFDAKSGQLLWRSPVESAPSSPPSPKVMDAAGYAAPTVATDGRLVYAIFANGDLAAFDFMGRRVWVRNLGVPENSYGHASSLLTHRNLLLVLYDQGPADDGKSRLFALDGLTGRGVWEAKRPVPSSWSTPIVVETPKGEQVVVCGDPWVIAYDPATGAERWRAECLGGEIAPSPVYANGMVFAANSRARLAAIRTDGQGDVTKTAIAWSAEDNLPDICSPLTNGDLVFLLGSDGMLTCYDARDGKKHWEKSFDTECSSSPSLVGNRVYVMDEKGLTVIVEAAREYKETGTADLGEPCSTSPAFLDGRIYLRGRKHLFCIGKR